MLIELGNPQPKDVDHSYPCVTYINIPDTYTLEPGMDAATFQAHIDEAMHWRRPEGRRGVTNLPNHTALLLLAHPDGLWSKASDGTPTWAWSDNPEMQRFCEELYGCPGGRPEDVEDTHWTWAGPPGVVPGARLDLEANITNNGRDIWARALGGGAVVSGSQNGVSTTAPDATHYTLDGKGAPGSTTAWTGQRIYAGSTSVGLVFAKVISNTNASPPVLLLDRWSNPGTPGGAAATTPLAGPWAIADGNGPATYIAITTDTGTPGTPSTATSLASEITTASGGLLRQIAAYLHTASASTYTLGATFTALAADVTAGLPLVIAKLGVFDSMVVGDTTSTMLFEEKLNAAATLAALNDNVVITETVTGT